MLEKIRWVVVPLWIRHIAVVMANESAGLLMYRVRGEGREYLLVHPGGPFWKNKDAGAWTIPKGEIQPGEDPLEAAKREFREELGCVASGSFIELTPIRQKAGKLVRAWAVCGEFNPAELRSNSFEIEWPPRSGKRVQFPEVDKAQYFPLGAARKMINPAQVAFLDQLEKRIA